MVSVKVFVKKNIVMKRMLVSRTFDIREILPIYRDFILVQAQKLLLTLKSGKICKYWQYCLNVKGPTHKYGGGGQFFFKLL